MIFVPKNVWDGLQAVRMSAVTNMLDVTEVIRCAKLLRFTETAQWIQDHERHYTEGVFRGFENRSVRRSGEIE
jgi:hypothetical protein